MKTKRWLAFSLILCLLLPLSGCKLKPAAPWPTLREGAQSILGSGNVVEKKVPLTALEGGYALRITGLSIRDADTEIELVIDESLPNEVVLTTDDNVAERIDIGYNAASGEIVIERQSLIFAPTKLTITVGGPVRALHINGAWRFTYNCPSVKACAVTVNGASNGKFTFGALETLEVDVNGASNITLAGAAKHANLTINGAANIRGFDLAAENAKVEINGAGNCEITATETLDAEIKGVGKVVYGGGPVVSKSIHGLGTVKAK